GIREVAGVAAPERLARVLHDRGPGALGPPHQDVDLGARRHVVAERHLGRAARTLGDAAVGCDALARPDREAQPALELEERDGAVLELLADQAAGREAEAVAVEAQRALEVVDAEGEDGQLRLHDRWTPTDHAGRG